MYKLFCDKCEKEMEKSHNICYRINKDWEQKDLCDDCFNLFLEFTKPPNN